MRYVELRTIRNGEPAVLHVAHDPDDFVPLRIALAERQALANRALVRPVLPRERIIHHCHADTGERIATVELAAADDRNPHHRKISVCDEANLFLRLILRPLDATSFDVKRAATARAT